MGTAATPTSTAPGRERQRARPSPPPATRGVQLALVGLLGLVFLRWTASFTLPLGFALFLVTVFWPLEQWARARMPRMLAVILVFFACLVTIGLLGLAIYLTGVMAARQLPPYVGLLGERLTELRTWAEGHGLPVTGAPGDSSGVLELARQALVQVSGQTMVFAAAFGLTLAFFLFAILELAALPQKLAAVAPGGDPDRWLGPFATIARALLRYMVVRTGIGLFTGAVVGAATWLLGLDLVPIWALTAFLLNYIPVVGSIVAVIPPTLFAAVQLDSLGAAALVLGVLTVIQFTIGNYLDPLVQGHYLSLSPLVVLVSIALWGFIWGIFGAFIGVPITVAVMLACHQFERTRWIAVLLADVPTATAPRGRLRGRAAGG